MQTVGAGVGLRVGWHPPGAHLPLSTMQPLNLAQSETETAAQPFEGMLHFIVGEEVGTAVVGAGVLLGLPLLQVPS